MVQIEILNRIRVRGGRIEGFRTDWYCAGDAQGEIEAEVERLHPKSVDEYDGREAIAAAGLDFCGASLVVRARLDGGDYDLFVVS